MSSIISTIKIQRLRNKTEKMIWEIGNWDLIRTIRIIRLIRLIPLLAIFVFMFLPKAADAGFIVNRPLYIGLGSGLVGSWSFDGYDMAGNTAYDRSDQANNGTLTNCPARSIGRIGQAPEFDGSNDKVKT